MPKQQMANRARRLPLRPSPESDPLTITRMPTIVTAMARQVRGEARSPRASLAMTAAKIGAAAMIATTLATSVFVTAITNAVMLMDPRMLEERSGLQYRLNRSGSSRPRLRAAIAHMIGVDQRLLMKAIVHPSASAIRMNRESVETRNIPVAASSRPSWRPSRGRRSAAIAGH